MPKIVPHGTLDYGEMTAWGYAPHDLVVFSSNINPYGPPPSVIQVLSENLTPAIVSLYPDRFSHDLRELLADHHGLTADSVLVGNGTADIMWLLAVLFLTDRLVTVLSPTFGEYTNSANLVGVHARLVALPGWAQRTDCGFVSEETDLSDTIRSLKRDSPDVVFLCNPNSPTGEHLTAREAESLLESAPDALWVIDEAYAAFTPEPWSAARWIPDRNIIVLRSMTKDFALGGLRLGYALARPATISALSEAQPPWNVNSVAQLAGKACLEELAWRNESMAVLRHDTITLRQALTELGFAPRDTKTNFFLVPVTDPAALRTALLHQKIVVRDCTSFEMPQYIRLATQRSEHNRILIEALSKMAQYCC